MNEELLRLSKTDSAGCFDIVDRYRWLASNSVYKSAIEPYADKVTCLVHFWGTWCGDVPFWKIVWQWDNDWFTTCKFLVKIPDKPFKDSFSEFDSKVDACYNMWHNSVNCKLPCELFNIELEASELDVCKSLDLEVRSWLIILRECNFNLDCDVHDVEPLEIECFW